MDINYKSSLNEVLQAISGTWDVSVTNDWTCVELGKVRLFKKLVDGAPATIKENVPAEEAEALKKKLMDAGASVELK